VKALFADTFYWAAVTNREDNAHLRAMELSRSLDPDRIITTDEVLCEYLAFFAGARPRVRAEAGKNFAELMQTMRREGLTEVLTNDRHFEQEGFRALFR